MPPPSASLVTSPISGKWIRETFVMAATRISRTIILVGYAKIAICFGRRPERLRAKAIPPGRANQRNQNCYRQRWKQRKTRAENSKAEQTCGFTCVLSNHTAKSLIGWGPCIGRHRGLFSEQLSHFWGRVAKHGAGWSCRCVAGIVNPGFLTRGTLARLSFTLPCALTNVAHLASCSGVGKGERAASRQKPPSSTIRTEISLTPSRVFDSLVSICEVR